MSFSVPAAAGLNCSTGTRVVEAAVRVPPLPSIPRPPPLGPVMAAPDGDGAAADVEVAGVLAHPAARPRSRTPCTTSAAFFMRVVLRVLSFTAAARSRHGPVAGAWPA